MTRPRGCGSDLVQAAFLILTCLTLCVEEEEGAKVTVFLFSWHDAAEVLDFRRLRGGVSIATISSRERREDEGAICKHWKERTERGRGLLYSCTYVGRKKREGGKSVCKKFDDRGGKNILGATLVETLGASIFSHVTEEGGVGLVLLSLSSLISLLRLPLSLMMSPSRACLSFTSSPQWPSFPSSSVYTKSSRLDVSCGTPKGEKRIKASREKRRRRAQREKETDRERDRELVKDCGPGTVCCIIVQYV